MKGEEDNKDGNMEEHRGQLVEHDMDTDREGD